MAEKDADGNNERKITGFTFRRELGSIYAVLVRVQPGFGACCWACLCPFPRPVFGWQPELTLHPEQQQPSWSEQQRPDNKRVKSAKITTALPLCAVRIKANAVATCVLAKESKQSNQLHMHFDDYFVLPHIQEEIDNHTDFILLHLYSYFRLFSPNLIIRLRLVSYFEGGVHVSCGQL